MANIPGWIPQAAEIAGTFLADLATNDRLRVAHNERLAAYWRRRASDNRARARSAKRERRRLRIEARAERQEARAAAYQATADRLRQTLKVCEE